jgi:UDP-N-acetylglucosamine--N-acetylmuramyl-(pentapeptide) pyrophosphoryl-undecaprenol N-acetylglucosamine transferase
MNPGSGQRRIAVAGGGTAGHILPALAVMRAYRRRYPDISSCFIGSRAPDGLETRLVPHLGERLACVSGAPWARQGILGKASALAALTTGVRDAKALLKQQRVQLLIGFGGYASIGACIAARLLGIPLIIHEANATPGQANRLAAALPAQRICIGFDETVACFRDRTRVVRTGTPSLATMDLAASPAFSSGAVRLLVLGGSLGSPHLNREAPALVARLAALLKGQGRTLSVRHFSGLSDPREVIQGYRRFGVADAAVTVEPFREVFPVQAYRDADLAVSCAGGITLAELAGAGVPALLVPLGQASAAHQIDNAKLFHDISGCPWVREEHWDGPGLAARVLHLLQDVERINAIRQRMLAWGTGDAAQRVVQVCEDVLAQQRRG